MDELARMLQDTHDFWNPLEVESVRLVDGISRSQLEVAVRLDARPQKLYVLHTDLSAWDFPRAGLPEPSARGWAGWLLMAVQEAVQEAVDAAPGLPPASPGQDVVRVCLD